LRDLAFIPEPKLLFGLDQQLEDPRDGLRIFGPFDSGAVHGIRWAAIGTPDGLMRFKRWVAALQRPMSSSDDEQSRLFRPPFPGFEAAYGIPFPAAPVEQIAIDSAELSQTLRYEDQHDRVHATVDLFAKKIIEALKEEEARPDIWFVVIPDEVYKYCRPRSTVEFDARIQRSLLVSARFGKKIAFAPTLFEDLNIASKPYEYEPHFHNQLKAKLLAHKIPTQIIRESTIAPNDFLNDFGYPRRRVDEPSTIAWNISNASFYKAAGKPWKLASVRPGVCYLGLVFKRGERSGDVRNACCAAQMFLDSGDGVVFRGAVGPWYSPTDRTFHLKRDAAKELIELAIATYGKLNASTKPDASPLVPSELFVHGKIAFDDEEWAGMLEAAGTKTKVVGVKIQRRLGLKLYTRRNYPVLRGIAHVYHPTAANLWTVGFIPRLQSYIGKELPNPLTVEVCRGECDLEIVLKDIMSLTKLNFNSCIFADGQPVTLRFADAVGEILTAGPPPNSAPLPFKYYI